MSARTMILPCNVPHRLSNTTGKETQLLMIRTLAGFEAYIREVGQRVIDDTTAALPLTEETIRRVTELGRQYGITLVDEAAW